MVALVKVLVAVALIFGMTAGMVSASQESLPGSVLYPVKVQFENVRLATTEDGEAKALLAMTYAQERVDEAVSLVECGDEIPEPLTARYQLQVGLALQTMEGLGEAQRLQLHTHFSGTLQNQVRVMTQLMARLHQGENPEHPEPTQARIQTMLQTMQQTQQQLGGFGPHVGGNETPGNAEAPGPNPNDNGNGEDNGNSGDNGECAGDCEGHNGETEDHDKHHQNGEDNGDGVSDNGQNNGAKGGNTDAGNGDANGGNGAPNDGSNDNGGSDAGGNGDSDNGGNGDSDNGGNGDGGGGNGGSGNGNGGGSGGGGN